VEFGGEAEDERAKADALHRAANGKFQARASAGLAGFVHGGILSEAASNSKRKRREKPVLSPLGAFLHWK